MPRQRNGNGILQRILFYLDRSNATLDHAGPIFRYLDSPNNINLPNSGVFEQSFPNFMQYYFNGLEPVESVTPDECANIVLTVYPNPSEDFLFIKSSIENCLFPAYIRVYNASGQFLREARVFSEPFPQIDLSTYPNGVYFLIIETFNRTEVKKVIKK